MKQSSYEKTGRSPPKGSEILKGSGLRPQFWQNAKIYRIQKLL